MTDHAAEVVIPAGPFLMGRGERDLFAAREEQPARIVTLSAFAIDVHPVSNQRYRAFVEAGGYDDSEWWSREGWIWLQQETVRGPLSLDRSDLAGDDQPACGLSWHEAQAFCRWSGRRLPTSAEWERAARGRDGRLFPWGLRWSEQMQIWLEPLPNDLICNFDGEAGRTSPLGAYPGGVSACGLHDMAGNVNNWVEDVYWTDFGRWCVRHGRLVDPVLDGALAEELKVPTGRRTDRGGGFLTSSSRFEVLATTYPLGWEPGSREPWHGFRTARSVEGPPPAG